MVQINLPGPIARGYVDADLPLIIEENLGDIERIRGYVKGLSRLGPMLQLVTIDGDGNDVNIRFIGAERQSHNALRRIAWIPDGETPVAAHFLNPAKSASSDTEAVDVSSIGPVVQGHRMVFWHEAAVAQPDLLTTADTLRDYIKSFGLPNPLNVDGVDGFYYLSDFTMRVTTPVHDLYYLQSRRGDTLFPIYLTWHYDENMTLAHFLDADRVKQVFQPGTVSWKLPAAGVIPPVYFYPSMSAQAPADAATFKAGAGAASGIDRPVRLYLNLTDDFDYAYLAYPQFYSPITRIRSRTTDDQGVTQGATVEEIDRGHWDLTNPVMTIAIDGVAYSVYQRTGIWYSRPYRRLEVWMDSGTVNPSRFKTQGIAYPADRGELEIFRSASSLTSLLGFTKQAANIMIDGVECQWYVGARTNALWAFTLSVATRAFEYVIELGGDRL